MSKVRERFPISIVDNNLGGLKNFGNFKTQLVSEEIAWCFFSIEAVFSIRKDKMIVVFFFKFGKKSLFAMYSSHGCQNIRYQHRIKASSTSSFDRWIV